MTRAELAAAVGSAYPLLLRALAHEGHGIVYEPSRHGPGWWRARLAYEASAPSPAVDEPQQLALGVAGAAPPRSAVLGLEDAA